MIDLDWDAYWAKFQEVHGQPVPFKGRLLFPDGFMYSASDPKGPEWRPDPKEVNRLALYYWQIRRKIVQVECRQLATQLENLEILQRKMSVPLQTRVVVENEDGTVRQEVEDLDITAWRAGRLKMLEADVAESEAKVAELQEKLNGNPSQAPQSAHV